MCYLHRRDHLALLLAVQEAVLVLHRDEGGEVVGDRIVYNNGGDSSIMWAYFMT